MPLAFLYLLEQELSLLYVKEKSSVFGFEKKLLGITSLFSLFFFCRAM